VIREELHSARMKCNEIRDVQRPISWAFVRWHGFYLLIRLSCRLDFAVTDFNELAGLPALRHGELGQVRKEAATAKRSKCRGQGSPPYEEGARPHDSWA